MLKYNHRYYKQLSKLRLNVSDIQFVALARRINPFIEQSGIDTLFQDLIVKNKDWGKGFVVYVNSKQDVKGHDELPVVLEDIACCAIRHVAYTNGGIKEEGPDELGSFVVV